MNAVVSLEQLAEQVNQWCHEHRVAPASGQAGSTVSERNIRYYRSLGLVDGPILGGGRGYGEKHYLQVLAIRILQARGLPLNRIRDLLYGRSLDELHEIKERGLQEWQSLPTATWRSSIAETWGVTPLGEEFLLVSRRGRMVSPELREQMLALLESEASARVSLPDPEERRTE